MPGLGDKPEDSPALPVLTGDTAEMACHHVGGASWGEGGKIRCRRQAGKTPTLGMQPQMPVAFLFLGVMLNYFLLLKRFVFQKIWEI